MAAKTAIVISARGRWNNQLIISASPMTGLTDDHHSCCACGGTIPRVASLVSLWRRYEAASTKTGSNPPCRPPSASRHQKEKKTMTLGVAVFATGRIVETGYVPAFKEVPDAKLVAVLSRDQARGEAFAKAQGIPKA